MTSVARVIDEVARRLDRDLAADAGTIEQTGSTLVTVRTRTSAGPVVRARIDDRGSVVVDLDLPAGDPWAPALAGVAEMHAELLGALLADPDLDLAAAPGLSKATEATVLGSLAGTGVDHGPFRSVPEQVLAAARSTPDAVAVLAADGTLTYRQFVAQAGAVGAQIRAAAPEPGSLLPVLVADGLALPVAWAGAMFAGVGYVPLDPRWPAQRIERVLDLLDAPVVLCTDLAAVPPAHRGRAVLVDPVQPLGFEEPGDIVAVGSDDVVYGVYTSGTTGTPLCAVNQHRGVANRLAFMTRWFGPPPGREVVLQTTPHTFDSAFWQVFWPLTTGGTTVVPAVGEHLDLQHTIELVAAHGVTVTDVVPAVLNALLSLLEQRPALVGRLRSLRHLVVGGEQINPHDVHRLRRLLPALRVSNGYGPSEAAIGMIFHEVSEADGDDVPLGRPIDNCAAVVVDVDGRPLPPGVTGEIVIGGACVGLGYHGEPERTAQRFFDCPWPAAGPVLSGRMYRTGDLGHVDALGRFHFAGRIDHQIKIGGVRLEPGEAEAAALALPGVRQAVALVVGPVPSRELVLVTTGPATSAQVLAHLRTRLPRHSIPQRCVVVEHITLTEAGKIDRRQLALQVDSATTGPPVTSTDPVLDAVRAAFRRPHLTAHDDVFAAGVNSLQAVAAVVALSDRFGVELGVRDLVDHPSAAGLRELLERRTLDGGGVPEVSALVAADLAALPAPVASTARRAGPTRTVLLTGATGFIGTRLLYELLEDPDLTVVCLVRGPDDAQARHRLWSALSGQGLDHPGFATRTRVVVGDLARPGWGLDPGHWRSLTGDCDAVVHNGAMVNFLYDYRMHREPNVLGTAEVIRFARQAGGIPVHYISTLGVLHEHALRSTGVLGEDIDLADVTPPASGYSLSKWVAERILRSATDLPVTLLRLGEVMPAIRPVGAVTGPVTSNPSAVTHLLLNAFERLKTVPRVQIRSDYTPVDAVARIVVAAVRDSTVWGRALHVYRPGSIDFAELIDVPEPARVSCARFVSDLRTAAATGDLELITLLAIIEHRADGNLRDETVARSVLENLLQDNPACFDRSISAAFERRHGLGADPVPAVAGR